MKLRKTIAAIFMAVPSSDYSAFIGKKLGVQMCTICDTVAQGHIKANPPITATIPPGSRMFAKAGLTGS